MVSAPELKKFLNKQVSIQLNGNRKVVGTLRAFDAFLNITLTGALEVSEKGDKTNIGLSVIRGNSVVSLEVCTRQFTKQLTIWSTIQLVTSQLVTPNLY